MRNRLPAAFSQRKIDAHLLILRTSLFILLASIPVHAQETSQSKRAGEDTNAAAASGSITGRVTGDDGRPIGDIQVTIFGTYTTMSPRSAVTDTSGRFQFNELPNGLYTVRAALPAYIEMPDENRNPLEPRYLKPGDSAQLTLVKGGVITGTAMNAQGEPIVGAIVRAFRVRDAQGRRINQEGGLGGMPRMTDDRGVYRLYGLLPGSYILVVGGGSPFFYGMPSLYENETPTYYPSATRDTAAEVTVRAGEEATGIDIRYRGERGHIVSGSIAGNVPPGRFGINVLLTRAVTGTFESQTYAMEFNGRRAFSLNGIPDGEYEIAAQGYFDKGDALAAPPKRITVRGADVTGLQLQLAPLASITGRVMLEPSKDEACPKTSAQATVQQTLVTVRRDELERERLQAQPFSGGGNVPNEQGEFTIRNLSGGLFRLSVRPPGEDWYVRSLALPLGASRTATSQPKTAQPAPGTLTVKTGERVTNVVINLAQGAASLRGRVAMQPEGSPLPPNQRVYLIPTERERADDLLRYAEANVLADGSFAFTSLAPGRYWVVLRAAPQVDLLQPPRMMAWEEEGRRTLRREAEAANNAVELKPCQQMKDYSLSYAAK